MERFLIQTIQLICFLNRVFERDRSKMVMLVCPVSVVPNWLKELKKWGNKRETNGRSLNYQVYHGTTKARNEALRSIRRHGGILITSYGMALSSIEALSSQGENDIEWDIMACDEGHKLKNPQAKTYKGLRSIKCRKRYLLTGTPVQNNLKEMWALFTFATGICLCIRRDRE